MSAYYIVRKKGYPIQFVRKVYEFPNLSSEGLYMAFSMSTPDYIVNKFVSALKTIKKNGIYKKIQDQFFQDN